MSNVDIGDYVLATKWDDGDPCDHWVVGFFTGILPKASGNRYMVADAEGNQFRGNGFRRIRKISLERGRWLLEHKQEITNGSKSLWSWVRQGRMKSKTAPLVYFRCPICGWRITMKEFRFVKHDFPCRCERTTLSQFRLTASIG